MNRLREIFKRRPEGMSRTVKWLFGFPIAYILYLLLACFVPSFGTGNNALLLRTAVFEMLLGFSFLIVVKFFLSFPLNLFFSEKKKFSFNLFLKGLFLMFFSGLASSFVLMLINPECFTYSLSSGFLLNWILSLILVLSAAFTEEIIFRMYIGHFMSDTLATSKNSIVIYSLVSGFFFSISHFKNPEAIEYGMLLSMLFYFIFGFVLMYFSFLTQGFELAIGIHVGNNLVSALFFGYENSVIKTNTIFLQNRNFSWELIIQLLICLFICYLAVRQFKKGDSNAKDR